MPLYEYQCKQCGHRFEKIQSFSAPEEKVCPKCEGELERLISAPALQFKGSGFYLTDYGKTGGAGRGESGGGSSSSPGDSSAPAGDSGGSKSSDGGSTSAPAAPAAGGSTGAATPGTSGGKTGSTS